jgi:biotin carboxyl carrier protein
MQYEIEVGGRVLHVVVARAGGAYTVTVDGKSWPVNAAMIDARTLSLLVETGGRTLSREVSVAPNGVAGAMTVRVGSVPVAVAIDARRRWARKDDGGAAGAGPQRILAPMPGKIVRVLVRPGDVVRARQPLVVIEAMKMENELRASRDGTVTDVSAREGVSVEAGAPLVVLA